MRLIDTLRLLAISATYALAACASSASPETPAATSLKTKDVPFVTAPVSDQQMLDIYLPTAPVSGAPVHVFVHGGAWVIGDKSNVKPAEAKAYTDRGVILVSVNYRLGPKHKYPANLDDIQSATTWLEDNIRPYGGDPENMVLSGHSAGAHLVALAAISAGNGSPYKAIIPVDTAAFDLTVPAPMRKIQRAKESVFGSSEADLKAASPALLISANAAYPPFENFVTAKRRKAVRETYSFTQALNASGHEATTHVLSGGLSHSDMKTELFRPGSKIFNTVLTQLSVTP